MPTRVFLFIRKGPLPLPVSHRSRTRKLVKRSAFRRILLRTKGRLLGNGFSRVSFFLLSAFPLKLIVEKEEGKSNKACKVKFCRLFWVKKNYPSFNSKE